MYYSTYTLCENCNNLTGTWYGNDYVEFAYGIHSVFMREKNVCAGMNIYVESAKIYPLRIVKQVASMFCSLNRDFCGTPEIDFLRKFVLNKDDKSLPRKLFKVGMYAFSDGLTRRNPKTVRCSIDPTNGNVAYEVVSEIAAYPLGFLLFFNPSPELQMPCVDITAFSDYQYDDKVEVRVRIPVYECNTVFPCDFRSREEIEQCIAESRKWEKEHENDTI